MTLLRLTFAVLIWAALGSTVLSSRAAADEFDEAVKQYIIQRDLFTDRRNNLTPEARQAAYKEAMRLAAYVDAHPGPEGHNSFIDDLTKAAGDFAKPGSDAAQGSDATASDPSDPHAPKGGPKTPGKAAKLPAKGTDGTQSWPTKGVGAYPGGTNGGGTTGGRTNGGGMGGGTNAAEANMPSEDMVQNHPREAIKVVNDLMSANPNNARLTALRASLKDALGDRRGALADARSALALDPKNQLARMVASYGDEASHAAAKAGAMMKNGFELRPGGPGDGGGKGGAERAGGGGRGGERSVGYAAAGSGAPSGGASGASGAPGAPGAPGTMGSAAGAAAGGGYALTVTSPFAKKLAAGWSEFRIGDYKGAIDDASGILAASPGEIAALTMRAAAYNRAGQPEKALVDADDILKAKPGDVVAMLERGYSKYQLGRYSDALVDVESALALEPLNAMGHLYRGMILEKLDRASAAIASYLRAGELDAGLKPLSEEAVTRLKGGASPAAAEGVPGSRRSKGRWAIYGGLSLLALAFLAKGVKRAVHPSLATPMRPLQ